MLATSFTRDDCQLGHKRVSYACLEREYRCNACGGRITTEWNEKDGWYPHCARCGGRDFIHECEIRRQVSEASEVLDGLPAELAEALGRRQFTPLPFEEARALLHPPIIEI